MAVSAQRRMAGSTITGGHTAWYYVGVAARYILLSALALIAFAPFILSFLGTFKTNVELTSFPPKILPEVWRLDNWVRVWNFTLPSVQLSPPLSSFVACTTSGLSGT